MLLAHCEPPQRALPRTFVIPPEERTNEGLHMYTTLLDIMVWGFFLGGLFGFAMGMTKYFGGGTAAEYGVMGIGGGFWLLSSAITIFIRTRQ